MASQAERNVQELENPMRAKELAEKIDVPFRLAEQICMIDAKINYENVLKSLKKGKLNLGNRQKRMLSASRNEFFVAMKEIIGMEVVKTIRLIMTDAQVKEIVRYLLGR